MDDSSAWRKRKVIDLSQTIDKTEALEVIDTLREAISTGKIKAFIAVGISDAHDTLAWSAAVKKTTRLEMMGAILHLQACYTTGDID